MNRFLFNFIVIGLNSDKISLRNCRKIQGIYVRKRKDQFRFIGSVGIFVLFAVSCTAFVRYIVKTGASCRCTQQHSPGNHVKIHVSAFLVGSYIKISAFLVMFWIFLQACLIVGLADLSRGSSSKSASLALTVI